jgi:hypothetical protein
MIKNPKRFPDTNGWGYAQFLYNAASDSFKPFGFAFTKYARR